MSKDGVQTTKVLIVAKTKMKSSACIGGIADDGRSLRLLAPPGALAFFNLAYAVGDVWRVSFIPQDGPVPPHTEDVVVVSRRKLGSAKDLIGAIHKYKSPVKGGLDAFFDGLAQCDAPGHLLYIAERTGVPAFSTQFWQPDRPLTRQDGVRVRYRYGENGPEFSFVGFQDPPKEIPAETVVRVSMARWWRPPGKPDAEWRCHLQVSGWFIEDEQLSTKSVHAPVLPNSERAAEFVLQSVFGYPEFRPHQSEIIKAVLGGQDALVVMPTGGGKSLCYQLPALLFDGLTVVVSPLISLMQDQVDQLVSLGVPAAYLNHTLDNTAKQDVYRRCRQGDIKMLYVAPETLLRNETLLLLQQSRLALLAVDEAHCISEYGPGFRPEYQRIVEARERCPNTICVALTATATERVRQDILEHLELREPRSFVTGFDRENLFLRVAQRTDGIAQVLEFLKAHSDEAGIIYCLTRKNVNDLTAELVANGVSALPYHAGLDAQTRETNQRRFILDDVQIIVATVAFGMGIDKSNVRFVIHYNLPQDIEGYYQQIGRAGRDGLPADCLLLYSQSDVQTILKLINKSPDDEKKGKTRRLFEIVRWAESGVCRRKQLLAYFDEPYEAENCGKCDVCTAPVTPDEKLDDLTEYAQLFLRCVHAVRESFGRAHIVKVLRASKEKNVLKWQHHQLDVYGKGVDFSRDHWNHLADQFLRQNLVTRDVNFGSLQLTEQGRAVLAGEKMLGNLHPRDETTTTAPVSRVDSHDPALFERLRALRKRLAQEANLPPYIIFSDRTLIEMAAYFPQSRLSFAALHGVGEYKLERYGDAFLQEIEAYCQEHQVTGDVTVAMPQKPPRRSKKRLRMPEGHQEIVDAFLSTESIQSAADACNIQPVTVMSYLEDYVLVMVRALPISLLLRQSALNEEQRSTAIDAFLRLGTERLKPAFEALGETVSYDELRLLRLCAVLMERQGTDVTTV